jgi:hypothetical protein
MIETAGRKSKRCERAGLASNRAHVLVVREKAKPKYSMSFTFNIRYSTFCGSKVLLLNPSGLRFIE